MKRFLATACVVLAAAFASAAEPDPLDPIKPAIEEQDRLMDQGKADQAIAAAKTRSKDGTPESFFLLGRVLTRTVTERVLRKTPPPKRGDPPPKLVFQGEDARMLDEGRESFERSKEAGELLYAPAHYGLGRVAFARGDKKRAVEELRQALRISKNYKEAAIFLAALLLEDGKGGEAEFVVYEFLQVRPRDVDARLLLGDFMMRKDRPDQAEPEFRLALGIDPANVEARRFLAIALMSQDGPGEAARKKLEESVQHWEMVRKARPKDDEAWVFLCRTYVKLKRLKEAEALLIDCRREFAGTEVVVWADQMLEQLRNPPEQSSERKTLEELRQRLDAAADEKTLQAVLEEMRNYKWPALPARVYRILYEPTWTPRLRVASLHLIADQVDPHTLTVLEVMLWHPKERDTDAEVRREVARTIAVLPTDAVVPVLFDALGDPDPEIREAGVKAIAARTGKWFRSDLSVRTPDADWPAELDCYRRWWASASASAAKRDAMKALTEIYGPVEKGSKLRVARYALPAMDDPLEATWRAGYDLFRALAFRTFGSETGFVTPQERSRIAKEARAWLDEVQRGTK
jgi:tetratricopeptide (TPR) repeat protein